MSFITIESYALLSVDNRFQYWLDLHSNGVVVLCIFFLDCQKIILLIATACSVCLSIIHVSCSFSELNVQIFASNPSKTVPLLWLRISNRQSHHVNYWYSVASDETGNRPHHIRKVNLSQNLSTFYSYLLGHVFR